MSVERVATEDVFPVCSPAFLAQNDNLSQDKLADAPLLLHSQATWNLWLERAGLEIAYPRRAVLFDDVAHTIRGALAGHGIAMARSHLVQDYLDSGRLIKLFDLEVPGLFSYFLAWRSPALQARYSAIDFWIKTSLFNATTAIDHQSP